ncbi:class I SAM-dependent methyltransferase [Maridesulfovibrio ferrireducens]|uniref:class I SAM-dependent methyltransferase n=1 Tax=Maridesulfovibrio ferrireducens TaxID=246191 RepID=UPI001A34E3EE|nr:class I SAM-dependent methyltransferase [Maridesulfovibrio ferrireducens]MBI9112134.1 class I SAM-dependent methyltransferase [Maridesulfovibrio ferrireducens]
MQEQTAVDVEKVSYSHKFIQDMVINPSFYTDSSLLKDVNEMSKPSVVITDPMIMGMVLKFFYCYVHKGCFDEVVPLEKVSELCEMFSRHRSLNEPDDDIELMNYLRQWSFSLRMLADIPKTSHIIRSIITHKISPNLMDLDEYVGLDIGTGTGILLLAQYIHARRLGFEKIHLYGIEYDKMVGLQSYKIFKELGIAEIILGDARESRNYEPLMDKQVTFVSNETVAAMHQPLRRDHFVAICRTLFRTVGNNIKDAGFFPEGLIAFCKEMNVSVLLAKNTAFLGPKEYHDMHLLPQGIIIEGNIVPLHQLGDELLPYMSEWARERLSRRW